jgi:hypothetical protein
VKINLIKNIFKNRKKSEFIAIVIALAAASFYYRMINDFWQASSALFVLLIGLPTLITLIMIKFSKPPKTAKATVFKAITYFLLLSSILFGEGLVCIIMAAPLFYGISALIILMYKRLTSKNKSKLFSILFIPIIIVIAQPHKDILPPTVQSVQTSITFNKNVSIDAFKTQQKFKDNYPPFFKIGFPTPIDIAGVGTEIGDTRDIQFESKTKGIGTLSLKIVERDKTSVTFNVIKDTTHIGHWLTWSTIDVTLIDKGENQTEVIWVSNFTCDLGPKWYFEPIEKYAVGLMNQYLIDHYFG